MRPPSLPGKLDQHRVLQVRFGKSRSETKKCNIVVNNVFGDDLKTETTSATQQETPPPSFAISNNKAFLSQSAAKMIETPALQGKQSIDVLTQC